MACLMMAAAASLPAAPDQAVLKQLVEVARSGAPELALARMDRLQPAPETDLVGWMSWERERIAILEAKGDSARVLARLAALPVAVPDDFSRWALGQRAAAEIDSGDPEAARATLRELLWHRIDGLPLEATARWRRMLVHTYLQQDLLDDARLALVRYRADFGDGNPEWRWLAARVQLRTGHPQTALTLVSEETGGIGKVLQLLARLRIGVDPAAVIERQALGLADTETADEVKGLALGVAALAAAEDRRPVDEVRHLEKALTFPFDVEIGARLLGLDADRLWRAYLALGQAWGNQEQRLLGRDEDWYFPATEALEKDPLRARVLFAVLAEYGSAPQRRDLAHEYLVSSLAELPGGERLIQRLYLQSKRFNDPAKLPRVIRYRLIDQALERGELETASRLMAGLQAPPRGTARFEWDLRRARVALFTGETEAGVQLLEQLLAGDELAQPGRVDRLLQVIFDLQTLQQHQRALALFDALLARSLELKQRRELLFWKADSYQALAQYDEAAWYYLKSATLNDPQAMDPWAQTARYRAAQALAKAGFIEDARRIYQSLLRATRDSGRRAVLRGELQRLRLLSGSGAKR